MGLLIIFGGLVQCGPAHYIWGTNTILGLLIIYGRLVHCGYVHYIWGTNTMWACLLHLGDYYNVGLFFTWGRGGVVQCGPAHYIAVGDSTMQACAL